MAIYTLLSQTGVVATGSIVPFPQSDTVRTIQLNPQPNVGFTGTVVIEGSYSATPGANDFQTLATIQFTGHLTSLSVDIRSDVPYIRARVPAVSAGGMAIFGTSRRGTIDGTVGSNPATAIIDSSLKILGTGAGFRVNAPVVAAISSDDVFYALDITKTMTTILNNYQPKIGTGSVTANESDVNSLAGTAAYGLVAADLRKLADVNASATEINHLTGATSNIQTQLNTLSSQKANASAVHTANRAWIDAFFTSAPLLTVAQLNSALSGITASAAELNILDGALVSTTELNLLQGLTASGTELNKLDGATISTAELNRLTGFTGAAADLNAITGLAVTGVTATQLAFLSGLSQNVQSVLSGLPNLTGLVSTVADMNLLSGAFAGTGAYSSAITANEIGYLSGLSGNIQTQLNAKRSTSVAIGWGEISGVGITVTELNYLSGVTSNVQAQLNALAFAGTYAAGQFSGVAKFANGSAGTPGTGFAGSATSGMYLYSGTGIGFSISGTRAFTLDGTRAIIGTGLSNGTPALMGSGVGVTDPAYQFVGDPDTGMYWISANQMGLVAGGEALITLNNSGANGAIALGSAADNTAISIPGMIAAEKILGKVDLTCGTGSPTGAGQEVNVYTVPTGRTAIITRVAYVLTSRSGSGAAVAMRLNLGLNSGSRDQFIDNATNTTLFNPAGSYNFETAGQVLWFGVGDNSWNAVAGSSGNSYQVATAGQIVQSRLNTVAEYATWNMTVIVFGYEY